MKVAFIGFGNMARALAEGFVRTGALAPGQIGACARDREKLRRNTEPAGYRAFDEAADAIAWADLVIVAVKPRQVEEALSPVKELLRGKAVLSIAAGYTFEKYEALLGSDVNHLSTIPNTPVAVGEGIVVCERKHSLTDEQWREAEGLLLRVGFVVSVDTPLLGIAGTLCGCGPAFVCLFVEALSDAAVKHGIPRADAYRMASQMIVGTGRLQLVTGQHPAAMKDAVCSPGGTTIVGVTELERQRFRGAVVDAIDAIEGK